MKYVTGEELETVNHFLNLTKEIAKQATCLRDKCGSIIVKDNKIIGSGFNSPPNNQENQRRCNCDKSTYHPKIKDTTCCIHAEQRAIMDALKNNPNKIIGSRLYFVRLNSYGNIKPSGKPYCTICSKMTLDSGVSEFVLLHLEGACIYDTDEYNTLSFSYNN
ncbi:hypothetical protein K9M48_00990 [Candidatus Gracilibacteria bacterium]|nr:hypothetical protein [Candidatus Gracilibacteria bacterium]